MGGAEDDTLVEGARRPQPDDLPTRAEGARRARPQDEEERSDAVSTAAGVSRLSTLGGTSGRSIATLRDTLRYQEAVSTRSFAFGASALAVVMAALLPWLDGDRTFAAVFAVALLLAALATAYIGVRLADPQRYSLQQVTAGALACGIAAVGGVLYFGVFSPAVVAVPFGLFFFSMAQGFWRTFAVYLISSIAYAALAVPVALEVWADRGLVRPQGLSHRDALLVVAAVEVVFFATFVVARRSRRSSERALAAHDRAVRAVAGRDALLQEARMDLEGVLRARGLGRFTDEVVGDYLLGNILGRGGMGEVYDAVHVDSEEPAAVKLLHPHVLGDTQAVDRFFRECALLESLDVDEVVRVRATSEAGAPIPFIAMERLHGEDLADHLRARGELEPREVVKLLEQVGRGVDAASAAGIVHRDLKPRNLFRAERGEGEPPTWKILDFGVSKLIGEATLTGQLVGTPSYMAPEQATGKPVTPRADLHALGVIAYRALTGRPAFSGESPAAILYQVVETMPPAPSSLRSRLHTDVDAVLAIAMAKDPEDRFASARELSEALAAAVKGGLSSKLRSRARVVEGKHPWAAR